MRSKRDSDSPPVTAPATQTSPPPRHHTVAHEPMKPAVQKVPTAAPTAKKGY